MEMASAVNNIIFGFLLTFLIIKLYYSYITTSKIDSLIKEYYGSLGMEIIGIYRLNLTEKIKYGVPLNTLIRFYGYFFTFFSLKIKPIRKVELIDKNQNEKTKYIELVIKRRELILCNEFDSYNI